MIYIPPEVMMEILLKVPFESILSCRLAAKQWKNIIEDPKFLDNYHGKPLVLLAKHDNLYCVIATHRRKITVDKFHHPPCIVRRIEIESTREFWFTLTWMAPNGIVCVRTQSNNFYLFNLFTGASHTVKKPSPEKIGSRYGFGYDGYGDYKILVASDAVYWVYSRRNDVWEKFNDFPYTSYHRFWDSLLHRPQACCFNGVLYWIVSREANKFMGTYDLHTCRFREIVLPDDSHSLMANLNELGGNLCYWRCRSTFDIWAMKGNKNEEHWMLLFRIRRETIRRRFVSMECDIEPTAICELEDGRKFVLFVCCKYGSLYWYNIDNGEVKVVQKCVWDKQRVIGGKRRRNQSTVD